MNYDFTEAELLFAGEVEKAAAQMPLAPASGTFFSNAEIKAALGLLAKTPYLAVGLDKSAGMGAVIHMASMESLASLAPSMALCVEMSTRVFGRLLAAHGSDVAKEKVLKPLLAGNLVGAVALSEGAMNVENDPFSTQGLEQGDGFSVTGAKNWVVNAPAADVIAVAGRVGDKVAFFLVPAGAPGLLVEAPATTMGYEAAPLSGLSLENCAVPRDMILGPFDAKTILAEARELENLVLLGLALGAMKSAFGQAKAHAKSHKSGGKPIIAFQEVGFKLSEMLTMLQASELLAFRAAWLAEKGDKATADVLLCAKVFVAECAEKVTGEALRILSGAGWTGTGPAQGAFRNAKWSQIAGTSTEIARVKIGDSALGYK
ncbi:MAG: acyl-CoA dehydrogenase [Proteobacteria bacterium]|nr:acyl-CoA dehydrogenase [Pseudomonadota bacterium]